VLRRVRPLVWPFFVAAIVAACGGGTASIGSGSDGADGGSGGDGGQTGDGSSSDGSTAADGGDSGGGGSSAGVVACGPKPCSLTGPVREVCCFRRSGEASCELETVSACLGHRLGCDEKADCEGANVCCAEEIGDGRIATRCMPTCITNAPRTQVCKSSDECESGSCKAQDCGEGFPPLKFCQRPDVCR
jgi:hypothetical protein